MKENLVLAVVYGLFVVVMVYITKLAVDAWLFEMDYKTNISDFVDK